MKIIGLSGGISSGKNTVAEILSEELRGAPIFDADKAVSALIQTDLRVIEEIKNNFPKAVLNSQIDRKILAQIVLNDDEKLQKLEEILHPKVRQKYQEFLKNAKEDECDFVILNIPLLLETKAYDCDYVFAITAQIELRFSRYVEREFAKERDKEILRKKFNKIHAKQISDEKRIEIADFVVENDLDRESLEKQIKNLVLKIS